MDKSKSVVSLLRGQQAVSDGCTRRYTSSSPSTAGAQGVAEQRVDRIVDRDRVAQQLPCSPTPPRGP
jgi:hypothetical protein